MGPSERPSPGDSSDGNRWAEEPSSLRLVYRVEIAVSARLGRHMSLNRWDLQGDLASFNAAYILQLLGLSRSTGILTLRAGNDEEALVCIVGGRPVYAYCAAVPSALDGLLMSGWQGEELWDRVVRIVGEGKVDRGALAEALFQRGREVVGRVLRWREGEFSFLARDPAPELPVDSDVNVEGLILDLTRQADEAGEEIF